MIPVIPFVVAAAIFKLAQKFRKPKPIGELAAADLLAVLDGETRLTDELYKDYELADVDRFTEEFATPGYVENFADCDNRAVLYYALIEKVMPGCLCGWEWVEYYEESADVRVLRAHAVNIFVDKDRVKWYVDAGSKKRFAKPAGWVTTFRYI